MPEREQGPTGHEQETEVPIAPAPTENTANLHDVRLILLDKLVDFVPQLSNVPGLLAIPFVQVMLMLTSDLDGQDERDKACVERLLFTLVNELNMDKPDTDDICQRSNKREVHLIIMRLLSASSVFFFVFAIFTSCLFLGVLMSRSKYGVNGDGGASSGKSWGQQQQQQTPESPSFVSKTTAAILSKAGVIDYCLDLLKALLDYWKT